MGVNSIEELDSEFSSEGHTSTIPTLFQSSYTECM